MFFYAHFLLHLSVMKKTKEQLRLVKSIVLSGKVDNCLTGNEQYQATGIKSVFRKKNALMVQLLKLNISFLSL